MHGTTVGLNAFLERKGTRPLLVMTAGLRDAYSIARHDRKELYALRYHKPERLVPRRDVVEVVERLRWDGSVDVPLDRASVAALVERLREDRVEAVAICLLHSYVNPVHELELRSLLLAELPELSITLSHEIAREWREYERASTAVLNAYIAPRVERYLGTLERELAGLADLEPAPRDAVERRDHDGTERAARSRSRRCSRARWAGRWAAPRSRARPAGATSSASTWAARRSTSASSSTVSRPLSTRDRARGPPVLMPLVDIHTIGAGGGSLAWLEAGGLRVGPQSAGADPGPACYGRGGTQPTVTDANLVPRAARPELLPRRRA